MHNILVSGLINIETTLKIETFPVTYQPVRYPFFGIHSSVSGVGYNIAKALTVLGDSPRFCSIIGSDLGGQQVNQALLRDRIETNWIVQGMHETAQSVIFYDNLGKRMINVDLKDIQDQQYPSEYFETALAGSELAVLSNINYSRPFLKRAKSAGVLVATDVHTIADLYDPFNRDFMAAADILFMSGDRLPVSPERWAQAVEVEFNTPILVVGLGNDGALLCVREHHSMVRKPAITLRPVVNTIGAGDALFSSFLHFFLESRDPYKALDYALIFAGFKVGEKSASEGFLRADEVESYYQQLLP